VILLYAPYDLVYATWSLHGHGRLDAAEKVREASLGTQFVLLTCHESFRYAMRPSAWGLWTTLSTQHGGRLVKVLAKAREPSPARGTPPAGKMSSGATRLPAVQGHGGKQSDISAFRAEIGKFAALTTPGPVHALCVLPRTKAT
jgi:hypothetical protein